MSFRRPRSFTMFSCLVSSDLHDQCILHHFLMLPHVGTPLLPCLSLSLFLSHTPAATHWTPPHLGPTYRSCPRSVAPISGPAARHGHAMPPAPIGLRPLLVNCARLVPHLRAPGLKQLSLPLLPFSFSTPSLFFPGRVSTPDTPSTSLPTVGNWRTPAHAGLRPNHAASSF
jgi:hypothetical protein